MALFENACADLVSNKYPSAAKKFADLLVTHGDGAAVRHNMALALECSQDFVAAGAEYLEVIRCFPTFMPSYLGLANCCLYSEEIEEAHHLVQTARDLAPDDPRPAIFLSEILFVMHKEGEAIQAHLDAVRLIQSHPNAILTRSHAMCHAQFGPGSPCFYMFIERSFIGNPILPSLPTPEPVAPAAPSPIQVVLMAHMGNAADIARRLRLLPRESAYLVTIDDIAAAILKDYAPNAVLHALSIQPHEFPALHLHIGRWLLRHKIGVVLPADDGTSDSVKLARAREALWERDIVLTGVNGDLAARPRAAAIEHIHPFRVPPLLRKGGHADVKTYFNIFPEVYTLSVEADPSEKPHSE